MSNPRRYSVDATNAVASSAATNLTLVTNTTIRPEIYEIQLGASGTPGDNALLAKLQRFTAGGTVTSVTPTPLDPADPAASASAGKTATVEPTYTANLILWHIALNQRASYRWVANPGGELKLPATASNGAGLYVTHASFTGNCDSQIYFNE